MHEIAVSREKTNLGHRNAAALIRKAADKALASEGILKPCLISVMLTDAEGIREVNRIFRGVDQETDVLSFPQFDDVDDMIDMQEETGVAELGDVVICMDRAAEQAEEFGHPLEREVIYLFVHSILHLLGYDHMEEEDKKEMRAREDEVMTELGIER